MSSDSPNTNVERLRIPRTIWALGFVSLFMDLSSELVHSLLPLFFVTTLGASALTVGVIEGIAESTAMFVKIFSGPISDFIGRRKGLMLLGYGLAALTKPLFPLAHSVEMIFTARFLDRIGKGIRGAPRDALVADVSPPEIRGACFGLRQSMDIRYASARRAGVCSCSRGACGRSCARETGGRSSSQEESGKSFYA